MPATHKPKPHLIGNRVASAKSRTEKVQEDIHLAEAELHLAHTVISEKLADGASDADLAKAVTHTEQVEAKLQDAHDDLQVVADLLTSEERDRKRLEAALEELRAAETPSSAGARSGSGSASVIEHLRELTRHKVSVDQAEPGRHDLPHTPPAA